MSATSPAETAVVEIIGSRAKKDKQNLAMVQILYSDCKCVDNDSRFAIVQHPGVRRRISVSLAEL